MRQDSRGDDGGVLDADPVMEFIFLLESPQNGDGVFHGGFPHEDRLEPTFQCRVFLDIFSVFVQCRGADTPQLSARECRFEHVGSVHGALRGPGSHEGMQFIDEEDYLPLRLDDLVQNRLEPVLELAPKFGAGDQGAQVQRDKSLVFQALRNIPIYDPLGEPLHDSGFPHARFPNENRIVLGPSG